MNKGLIISGIGHVGLILWALLGGWLFAAQDVPEIKVTDVSIISTTQYDAMVSAAPKVEDLAPTAVAQPAQTEPAIDTPTPPDTQTQSAPPVAEAQPAVEPPPEAVTPPDPVPVDPNPQTEAVPPPVAPPADLPQPIPQPKADKPPKPRPVTKIADVPVDPSPNTPKVADTPTPKPTDTPTPDVPVTPPKPEAAPDAASTVVTPDAPVVTDNAPQLAPTASQRPKSRPEAPVVPDTTVADAAAADQAKADKAKAAAAKAAAADQAAIDAAVADAAANVGTGGNGAAPLGPPLSSGEIDNLHRTIAKRWNVGALSTDASQVVVVVSVTLTQDQKVQEIHMISFTGGPQAAADLAFEAAARAVKRAANDGFNLPPEKYDDWKDLELTFNPTSKSLQ